MLPFFALLRAGVSDFDFDIDFDYSLVQSGSKVDLRSSSVTTRQSSSELDSALAAPSVQNGSRFESQDFDFDLVEDWATKQNVMPLVYDGYERYYEKCGLQAPIEKKLQWFAASNKAERHYNEHLNAIRTMSEYLAERNLRVMILKGYSLSLCYPKPSHRPCGDIDIYCFGDYKKVDETVANIALCKVDKSHHHHTVFHWNGIMVENHYDFVNVYSHPVHKEIDRKLKEIAEREECEKTEDGVLLPSPNLAVLFTLIHSVAHFVAQGVELRHLVDWYLLRKKYKERVDWTFVTNTLTAFGFDRIFKIWNELADWLFEGDFSESSLSEDARKVLGEILEPQYGRIKTKNPVKRSIFKVKRWFGSRWKMRLVYTKENLVTAFFVHLKEKSINPERIL